MYITVGGVWDIVLFMGMIRQIRKRLSEKNFGYITHVTKIGFVKIRLTEPSYMITIV